MKNIRKLIAAGLLFCILMIGFSAGAQAAPSLKWNTDAVHYDDQGRLVVEGYFYNDGTRVVSWVKSHHIQVYFRTRSTAWRLQVETTFSGLNVYLRPGESSRWTLRITNVDIADYEYWYINWQVEYEYL